MNLIDKVYYSLTILNASNINTACMVPVLLAFFSAIFYLINIKFKGFDVAERIFDYLSTATHMSIYVVFFIISWNIDINQLSDDEIYRIKSSQDTFSNNGWAIIMLILVPIVLLAIKCHKDRLIQNLFNDLSKLVKFSMKIIKNFINYAKNIIIGVNEERDENTMKRKHNESKYRKPK